MIVTIDSGLEARVASGAHARGISEEQYVNLVLTRSISGEPLNAGSPQDSAAAEELLEGFRKLAAVASPVPDRSGEFFTRDILYADHD